MSNFLKKPLFLLSIMSITSIYSQAKSMEDENQIETSKSQYSPQTITAVEEDTWPGFLDNVTPPPLNNENNREDK